MHIIVALLRSKEGTTPIEYGLIAALVSIALLVGVGGFANGFEDLYLMLSNTMTTS